MIVIWSMAIVSVIFVWAFVREVEKNRRLIAQRCFLKNKISALKQEQEELKRKRVKKACFIGLGGGGCNIIEDISRIDNCHRFIYVNSDKQALDVKRAKYKILLGGEDNRYLGCGGQTRCANDLIDARFLKKLFRVVGRYKRVYIVASLGGGVGSGSIVKTLHYLLKTDKKVKVVVTLPFSFEGKKRSEMAKDTLQKLQEMCDDVIVVENDDILELQSKTGVRKSFQFLSNKIYEELKKC